MGDLDLTEFWGHDDLQKLAKEADFNAERMASSMLEELSVVEREWLDEGEEAEDYMEDIQELAEKVCEQSYNESGSYQDEASQDEDEDSPSEDEDEAAVLHDENEAEDEPSTRTRQRTSLATSAAAIR